MIKGRRTRYAGKSSTSNSAKPNVDESASPKRKDFKSTKGQTSSVTAVQINKKHNPHAREPIMLRGGRLQNVDIACYLHPTDRSKTAAHVVHPKVERIIDITDENTCDAFQSESSDYLDIHLPAVPSRTRQDDDTVSGSRKTNNYNNNNIFLQEPVLSLNLDKTSTEPTRTLKMMQKPFSANSNLKTSLFSSLSQPKIDSLWKNASMTTMCNNSILNPQNVLIKPLEQHALDLSKPTQVTHIDSTTATAEMQLHHDDSNSRDSGDSGVVVLSSNNGTSTLEIEANEAYLVGNNTDSAEKRRKPATPHRILCPSPIKHVVVSSSNLEGGAKSSAVAYNKKSQTVPNKTRKRLNVHDAENSADTKIPDPSLNDHNHCQTQYATAELHPTEDKLNITRGSRLTGKQPELAVEPLHAKPNSVGNKKITEFYPVRRSVRKTKKEVQVERDRDIEHAIQEEREEGLKIHHFEGKGRGVVTTRPFCKGEFVVEYIGDLISVPEAKLREQMYAEDDNTGCYMYYFKHKNLQHCIDATAESGKLGRLVNHSRNGNLVTKTVPLNNRPHLVLIAKEDIDAGVEVTYDYGDRSKEALQYYPWLAL